MKIVFDCREEGRNATGIGTYVRNLAREIRLRHEPGMSCLCVPEHPGEPPPARVRSRAEQLAHLIENLYWKQLYLPARYLVERADLLVCMDPVVPFACPGKMAAVIYDLIFLRGTAQASAWTYYWRLMVPYAARRADLILTLSEATKTEIVRRLHVPESRIKVFRTGVAPHFRPMKWSARDREVVRSELGLPPAFILSVGAHDPRRNLKTLLEAFRLLVVSEKVRHALVVIGAKTRFFPEVLAHTRALGLSDSVLYLDHVPHERLHFYYNLADLYVYPSLEEGFGLTPLEAMACGCPVVASNVSALPEAVGDAALVVDPRDARALSSAMGRLLRDRSERRRWRERGLERTRECSWRLGADDILEACAELVGRRG